MSPTPPPPALISAKRLPQLLEDSASSICLQDLCQSGGTTPFRTSDNTLQGMMEWRIQLREEELLFRRSSTWDFKQVQMYLMNWRIFIPTNDWSQTPIRSSAIFLRCCLQRLNISACYFTKCEILISCPKSTESGCDRMR